MINDLSVLAVIPARGGSKGVPRKNLCPLAGKPLIAWTIEAALKSQYIDRLVLSSDDPEIMAVARSFGCEAPFMRPAELATDTATSKNVVLHCLAALGTRYDVTLLLQPTSPLRTSDDIDHSLEQFAASGASTSVSVTEASKSPYLSYTIDTGNKMTRIVETELELARRQDLPRAFEVNGAIYLCRTRDFLGDPRFITRDTVPYVMPKKRSVDIDDETDLLIAETLLRSGRPTDSH